MRPAIRTISTIGGGDPAKFHPVAADFSVVLRVMVGPVGAEGQESFDLTICSPAALEKECERDGFVLGRHRLIASEYNYPVLRQVIEKLINRCSGTNWPEVAAKISRIGYWEFEDYAPESK